MHIYGIQYDFMHRSCWNQSNFENSRFYSSSTLHWWVYFCEFGETCYNEIFSSQNWVLSFLFLQVKGGDEQHETGEWKVPTLSRFTYDTWMLKSTHFVKHLSPLEILQSPLVCNRLLIYVTPLFKIQCYYQYSSTYRSQFNLVTQWTSHATTPRWP